MTDKILIDRSVVEQALTTLEGWGNYDKWVWPESALFTAKKNTAEMITALRAALEQPQVEQEPVACSKDPRGCWSVRCQLGVVCKNTTHGQRISPAYTHPQPKRQPLTDEQVMQAVRHLYQSDVAAGMGFPDDLYVARAIEAAHGIGE